MTEQKQQTISRDTSQTVLGILLWASIFLLPLGLVALLVGLIAIIFSDIGAGFVSSVDPGDKLEQILVGLMFIAVSLAILGAATYFFIRRSKLWQASEKASPGLLAGLLIAIVVYVVIYFLFRS